MKKLNLLLTIILGIAILSCSSDNDNNNDDIDNNNDLIGTWYGISSTLNGNNSGIPDNSLIKFTSDNRVEFIYENSGNNGEDVSEFGNWTKNGNTITINWDNSDQGLGNYILEILTFNESTLKWRTEINGEGTLIETFSKNPNATVDLSQFQNYHLNFHVHIIEDDYLNIPFEYEVTIITTNGNNQTIERTETFTDLPLHSSSIYIHEEIVKEYKVVGVRIDAISNNVESFYVELIRASDQNTVLNLDVNIPNTATVTYDFETEIETVTSN